jgi:DNA-binding transcriptional ArsR family regulator
MSTSEQADAETNAAQSIDSKGELPDEISQKTGGGPETAELPLDRVFEILKNKRRREVLRHLRDQSGQVDLGDLAEHVAAVENDTTTQALTTDERKRVYVGLYQCHLPKMDDIDIVDFNQDRGYVELGDTASQLDSYLDTRETEESLPWHRYYGAAALIGVVAVVAAMTLSLGGTASLLLFGGVVALFASCSTWQWFVESGGELSI